MVEENGNFVVELEKYEVDDSNVLNGTVEVSSLDSRVEDDISVV